MANRRRHESFVSTVKRNSPIVFDRFSAPCEIGRSAAADRWKNRELCVSGNRRRQPACIPDIFLPHEQVDVLADLPFLGCDAISKGGAHSPERLEGVTRSGGRASNLDSIASTGKRTQRTRYVKGDRH